MTDRRPFATRGLALALLLAAAAPAAAQSTYYWNSPTGPGSLWSDPNNWWTSPTGPVSVVAPGAVDLAWFNGTGADGATTVQINATTAVLGMTFANTGTTLLSSSSPTSQTLTIGASGITINSGAGAVTLGDATNLMPVALAASQTWANNSANPFTVVNGVSATGAQTLTIGGSGSTTVGGPLTNGTGTLSLVKAGPGTLTLAAANTYTGGTVIRNGVGNAFNGSSTLKLDFSNPAAPASDILANGSALSFGGSTATPAQTVVGGGVLNLTQNASAAANSQTFGATTVGVGASGVTMTAAGGNPFVLNLGAITRTAGGTLNVTQPSGTVSATNGVLTSSGSAGVILTDANGTAFATVGGADWASKDATNAFITAFTGYTTFSASGPISGDANVTGSGTATSGSTFNSVRFLSTAARTLTLAGTNTITAGGVLVAAGSTAASTITGGTIRAGAGRELVFINNAPVTAAALALNSVIADSASGPSSVTFRSLTATTTTGSFSIGASNTYTGDTYITAGRVSLNVAAINTPLGTGNVYIDGNTNGQFATFTAATGNITNHFYIIGNGWSEAGGPYGALRVDGGTVSGTVTLLGDAAIGAQTTGSNGTISGTIEGPFNVTKVGAQPLKLTGTNTYTGTTTIAAGTLQIGNGTTGTLGDGTGAVVNNGALIVGRTNAYALTNTISGTGTLTVSGAGGVVTLTGANTYTGATTVSAGTLILGAAGGVGVGLASSGVTVTNATFGVQPGLSGASNGATNALSGNLTLNAGSTFTMADGITSTANVGGTATLAPATSTSPVLRFEFGAANETTDKLAITGAATVGAATATLTLAPLATPNSATNTYTLITAASGLSTNFTLAGQTTYVIGGSLYHAVLTNSTATSEVVSFDPGAITPGTAYWTGSTNGSWSTQNANFTTNFTSDTLGQTNTYALPDGTTAVVVSANTASNLSTMTVDGVSAVKGITFTGTGTSNTAGATIAAGTAASLTINSGGITVQAGSGANTITAPVTLGTDQSWTNNSSNLLTVQGDVTNSTFLLTVAGSGNTTINGTIGNGTGGLTKAGAGTLTLTAPNTYTGATTISGGTLILSGGDNRLAATGTVNFSGSSTLNVGSTSQSLDTIGVTADGVTGTVTGNGGTLTLTGNTFSLVTGSTTNNVQRNLNLSGLSTFTYNNPAGTFRVDGAPTASLRTGSSSTLTLPPTSTITAANLFISMFAITGTGAADIGTINLGQSATINADTISIGTYQDTGRLQYGSSTANPVLTLRGTSGGTSRTAITVGNNSGGANNGPGIVDLTTNVTGAGNLDALVSTLTIGTQNRSVNATFNMFATGTFIMGGGTLDATTIMIGQITSGSTATGGTTAGTFTASSGGNVKVQSLYLGDTNITSGSVQTVNATLNLNGGAVLYAQSIAKGPGTGTVGTLNRTINWNDGTIRNYDAATDLTIDTGLTMNVAATGTHTFNIDANRTGTVNTVLAGAGGAVTKAGGGTLVLAGVNTYTGATTVNGGVLRVNGSLAAGSAVAVSAGGALGGTGTVNGPVTFNTGSTIDPGASVGTLTVANNVTVTGGTGTKWNVELNGTTPSNADLLNVTGATSTLNFVTNQPTDKITINLVDLVGLPVNTSLTYTVASVAPGTGAANILTNGTAGFDPTQFAFTTTGFNASNYSISRVGDVVQVGFTVAPVPEPAFVLAACGAGAAGLGWWRRRRASKAE